MLAASLGLLGYIRREIGRESCVPAYEESLELSKRIGNRVGAAICAFNLGHVFKNLPTLRDLDQAEHWYRTSLELRDVRDRFGRGQCVGQLGFVAYERFSEAGSTGHPEEEILRHFNEALRLFHEALDLLPADAVEDLATMHNLFGNVYGTAGELDRAVHHFRKAVQLQEQAGNLYQAAQARHNIAIAFFAAGRQADALEYAEAALRGLEFYGTGAGEEWIENTRGLIAKIRGT